MIEFLDFLSELLKENKVKNYQGWIEGIKCAIEEKRFEWFYKNERCVGFYTWLEKYKNGEQYIYVGNLFIYPSNRSMNNVFLIRREMKNKFPKAKMGYWINTKREEFVYD